MEVVASPISYSQIYGGVTLEGCQTPAVPVKAIGDGILLLPPLAVPIHSMETNPSSFQSIQDTNRINSPGKGLDSPGRRLKPPVFEGKNPDD